MMALSQQNEAWVLSSRPGREGLEVSNFERVGCPMPVLAEGGVLLKTQLISVDPYLRGKLDEPQPGKKSYFAGAFEVGKPLSGSLGSVVIASASDSLKPGDFVTHFGPWQLYTVADQASVVKREVSRVVPLEKWLSSLAYSGLSSWLPIMHIGRPKRGEVAFVTGAAGAVGSMACQILLQQGCTVVGSAGTEEKVAWLRSIGVCAFNWRDESCTFGEHVARECPNGIDLCFENVGGAQLEAILEEMNVRGRIIACGAISQYDKPHDERYGVKNLFNIVTKRLRIQGFIMSDWTGSERKEAEAALEELVREGLVQTRETVLPGFDRIPEAFIGLFTGSNVGKMFVRVD